MKKKQDLAHQQKEVTVLQVQVSNLFSFKSELEKHSLELVPPMYALLFT